MNLNTIFRIKKGLNFHLFLFNEFASNAQRSTINETEELQVKSSVPAKDLTACIAAEANYTGTVQLSTKQ